MVYYIAIHKNYSFDKLTASVAYWLACSLQMQ